jgi:hypothetical protein
MYIVVWQVVALIGIYIIHWLKNNKDDTRDVVSVVPGTKYKREELCRNILEKYFNRPFNRVYPKFLINDKTGRRMELDCYNEELKLALEHHGIQHYRYPNSYHHSRKQFEDLQYRDKLKKELCKKEGVNLIVVPYTVPEGDLETYIKHKLHKLGYINGV